MNNNNDENQAHYEEQEQQVPTTTLSLPSTASIMEWMMEKQQEEEQEQQQGRRSHHITLPPLPTPFKNFERSQRRRTSRIPTGNEMVDKMNDVMDILDEVEMILDTPEPEYNNLLFGNTSSSSRRNIPSSSSPQLSQFENCYYRKQ